MTQPSIQHPDEVSAIGERLAQTIEAAQALADEAIAKLEGEEWRTLLSYEIEIGYFSPEEHRGSRTRTTLKGADGEEQVFEEELIENESLHDVLKAMGVTIDDVEIPTRQGEKTLAKKAKGLPS